jgi:ubiquinone/menaquinone biosynthesis C-methylase UbiE
MVLQPMLPRTLEPEVMDDRQEAVEYNEMDHRAVNDLFVQDLMMAGPLGRDVLDLGTGTALIPVALCLKEPGVRVMASDASVEMLELARYNIEIHRLLDRVQLHRGDAKKLVFGKEYFDTVMSNSLVHHLPTCDTLFEESLRVLRPGGLLFVRDLARPETEEEVERLVDLYTQGETEYSKQLFRQSLHASLTVPELQQIVAPFGIPATAVQMTSDRHWTLVYRKANAA